MVSQDKQITQSKVTVFEGVLPYRCSSAEGLVTAARLLLFSSEEAEDGNVLLAKAVFGNKTLLFTADRDNYEFVLKTPHRKSHVAGGALACDLHGVSLQDLKTMMTRYLEDGRPLIRYNKLRKLKKDKNRHGLQTSGRMKLPHTILRGVCKPCPRKLYS